MAAELVHAARSKKACKPVRLRFFYYIAGSGGVGPTTLASSFLLLGEDVIAYNKEEIKLKPYSGALNIDFGKGVGNKNVYLRNLPEVKSTFKVLRVPTVSARFGSDPFIWNWGMHIFANFLPIKYLRDKNKVSKLVEVIDPIVRTIDGIAGQCVSMRPEGIATKARKLLLERATQGATNFVMNK
ncbi:uncharacterized protein C2845_PM05G06060 [Panicum miliaceum]|uniref:Uncharacterized protein n=1 Tax=Panicum miliaceum TaxID=4540 RepID=A0A3L6SWY3_PANMI|nr:uncharacterized protein C2845_PM05G06060 [Panicum miliaceum]